MKVIVFGATGTVGTCAVNALLQDGHHVTAFARRPERLTLSHDRLTLIAGDALQQEEVAEAIRGHDSVVVTLGAGASLAGRVRSQGTLNVIRGMQRHGVRRLICQSTLGAQESWANLNFFWKRIMFGLLLRAAFHDHELQEKLVQASGLDWTIVRPGAFAKGPERADVREGFPPTERGLSLKVPVANIARFLARQVADRRYAGRAVSLSA